MKRTIAAVSLVLLAALLLSFTQAFASSYSVSAVSIPIVKKTPTVGEPAELQTDKYEKKEAKQAEKDARKEAKEESKPDKPGKPDKPQKPDDLPGEGKPPKGKPVNFRGIVEEVGENSLTITLKHGGTQTVGMDENTRVHIPTMGSAASTNGLSNGMEVSVHAIRQVEGESPLAVSIQVIPGKPSHVHRVGTVTAYEEGASITVQDKGGQEVTYSITDAKILPKADVIITAGTQVTVVTQRDVATGELAVKAVVVHQSDSD